MMKAEKSRLLIAAMAACGLGLSACSSPSGQDDGGNGNAQSVNLSGTVVDGRIAGGMVWADLNDNSELDGFEEFGKTDRDGYFSYNPKTGVNYCTDADADNDIFCLDANLETGSQVIIRIKGGYNVSTGEPFYGTMSGRVTVGSSGIPPFVTTPLTGLMTYLTKSEAEMVAGKLTSTGLAGTADVIGYDDLWVDFYDEVTNPPLITGNQRKVLLDAAMRTQKFVEAVTKNVEDAFDAAGADVPPYIAQELFKALVEELKTNWSYDLLAMMKKGSGAIANVLASLQTTIQVKTGDPTFTLDATLATASDELVDSVETLFAGFDTTQTDPALLVKDAEGRERASQVVTNTVAKQPSNVTNIANARTVAENPANTASFQSNSMDVGSVSKDIAAGNATPNLDFSNRPFLANEWVDSNGDFIADTWNVAGTATATPGPAAATLSNSKMKLVESDLAVGLVPNKGVLYLFPDSDPSTDNGGKVVVCVDYDENHDGDYLDEDEFHNEKFVGTWERIGPYTAVLNITVLDSPKSVIVKSIDYVDAGGNPLEAPGVAPVAPTAVDDKWRMQYDFSGDLDYYDVEKSAGASSFMVDIAPNVTPAGVLCELN